MLARLRWPSWVRGKAQIHSLMFCKPTRSTHLLANLHSTVQGEKKKHKVAEEWFRLKSMLIWSGIQRDFPVGSRTPLMPFWGGSFSSRCCSNYCWVCCLPSWSYPGIRAVLSFWAMGLLTRILVLGVTGGRSAVRYGTGPWWSLGGPSWTWQTESSELHGLPSPPLKWALQGGLPVWLHIPLQGSQQWGTGIAACSPDTSLLDQGSKQARKGPRKQMSKPSWGQTGTCLVCWMTPPLPWHFLKANFYSSSFSGVWSPRHKPTRAKGIRSLPQAVATWQVIKPP